MATSKCLFLTAKCIVMFQLLLTILGSALIIYEHHTNGNLHTHKKFNVFFPDSFAHCNLFIPYLIVHLVGAIGLWFNHISVVIIVALDSALTIVDYLAYYWTNAFESSLANCNPWVVLLFYFILFNSVKAYLSYNLFTMWMVQRKEKSLKTQDKVKILFKNEMDGDQDDVVYKV